MTSYDSGNAENRSLAQDLWVVARYYLGSRTGIVAMAAVAVGAGAFFNWSWLVAAGIAPLLLTVLPCVAMCALGLCMAGGSKSSDAKIPQVNAAGETAQSSTLRLPASDGNIDPADELKEQNKVPSSNRKGCC